MAGLADWQELCADFESELEEITDKDERRKLIMKHIEKCDKLSVNVPEFDTGLEWMNSERALTLHQDLRGGLVVLDFFTYCCINCMHVLPDLEALEHAFPLDKGVAVIGVHSAKFANEKVSANILSAVLRYGITHPVVNDFDAKLWNELLIQCWPTLTVVSPSGNLLYSFVGEGHREKLLEFATLALEHYNSKGEITLNDLPLKLAKDSLSDSPLRFPGKVCCSEDGKVVVVADTGHHRVLVLGNDGIVKYSVGGGSPGFRDGSFTEALFSSPQGVCHYRDVIYVADTENHAIRKIDLKAGKVVTIAGRGYMGEDKEGGQLGIEQAISSPWDVTIVSSIGSSDADILLIAMAGSHQIWGLFLQDGKWFKGRDYPSGTCVRLAGNGNEENRNNSYPEKAAFAQPSGLAFSKHWDLLLVFVADAESSSVRTMSLKDGAVKALVGGERDPRNLFAYGDEDGKGYDARLQHPLGVTVLSHDPCVLAVADSYNHKIKKVDVGTKQCTSLLGTGKPGNTVSDIPEESSFNEPGGLFMDHTCDLLYVADTNNHAIKIVNVKDRTVQQLPVIFVSSSSTTSDSRPTVFKRLTAKSTPITDHPPVTVTPEGKLEVKVQVNWRPGAHLTEGAPSQWQLWYQDDSSTSAVTVVNRKAFVDREEDIPEVIVQVQDLPRKTGSIDIFFEAMVYFCEDSGLCKMRGFLHKQPITLRSDASECATQTVKLDLS